MYFDEQITEIKNSINDSIFNILEYSNEFLNLYKSYSLTEIKDSSLLKSFMKDKIEKGIVNHDS